MVDVATFRFIGAIGRIIGNHAELGEVLERSCEFGFDMFCRSAQYQKIIDISNACTIACVQIFIEIAEQDISKQRRQCATLSYTNIFLWK